jgi:NodT family efflux transporter outer membrane factor (OMF) lipoprotein
MMRRASAAGAVLLLAGCAGPRPSIPQSAAVVAPTAWRVDGGAGAIQAIQNDWWESFGDPALNALVGEALRNNVDVMVAASRVAQARAQFRLVASAARPAIGVGGQGGYGRSLNAFGVGLDQVDGTASVTGSYELDLFGRLAEARGAARADLLASQAARDTVRLAVAAQVVEGYIGLRALEAQLAIAQDTLATRAQELELIRHRAAAGYSPALDLAQAEAEYQVAAQLVPATRSAITRQENGLSLLLGKAPGAIAPGAAIDGLVAVRVPVSLPAQVLRQRPDIAEAEDRVVAADRQLDVARAAFLPRIQLSASGGAVASNILPNPVSLFSLGGSILAPLFEGGALRARQSIAAATRDQAAFAYRKAALTAFAEVENAMESNQRLAQQLAAAEQQRAALATARALAVNRYRAGYAPYLDQLDAERGLLSARLSVVDLRAARLRAIVVLYRSLGGGWSAPVGGSAVAP